MNIPGTLAIFSKQLNYRSPVLFIELVLVGIAKRVVEPCPRSLSSIEHLLILLILEKFPSLIKRFAGMKALERYICFL